MEPTWLLTIHNKNYPRMHALSSEAKAHGIYPENAMPLVCSKPRLCFHTIGNENKRAAKKQGMLRNYRLLAMNRL